MWLPAALCFACGAAPQDRSPQPASAPAASRQEAVGAPALAPGAPSNPAPPTSAPEPTPFPCAELSCTTFANAIDAARAALSSEVRVVGFGEAHAPGHFRGRTTVKRFTEDLLPSLAARSKHLLVELLVPPKGCEKERQKVQAESDAITEGQAEENQSEYVALGHAARSHGVVPDVLHPSCEEMQAVAAADVGVLALMETIALLSQRTAERWLAEPAGERPLVLLYGGALHNDVSPREPLATWSYGPRLIELSGGHYVEVDLVVPELVGDTDSWKKFAWYGAVRSLPPGHGTTLVRVSERSFALVFAALDGTPAR